MIGQIPKHGDEMRIDAWRSTVHNVEGDEASLQRHDAHLFSTIFRPAVPLSFDQNVSGIKTSNTSIMLHRR